MQSNVNYILEEIIGEGAMAIVYKARHRDLDSLHAIKKLKIQDFDVQKRLIQEGRLLANIRHPNILSVTDLVKLEGTPSLVMEFIQGPSLASLALEHSHHSLKHVHNDSHNMVKDKAMSTFNLRDMRNVFE